MTLISHSRSVAKGKGWCVSDEVCQAGPSDRPFEEQHSRFSVSAVLGGTFAYRSSGGRALMSPGSLLLGQQDAQFSCSHEHGWGDRCIAFYFDESWIEDLAHELPGVRSTRVTHVRIPPAQCLAPLIADVQAFADGPDLGGGEELVFRIAAAALTFFPAELPSSGATPAEERRIVEVLRALDDKEISEPLSLARLAGAVGMSRYYFLRAFQRVTGQTPWHFILSRRLAIAAHNLTLGRGTVLDAAIASGFTDLSEFTRRFRRHFGVTPGVYRHKKSRYNVPE